VLSVLFLVGDRSRSIVFGASSEFTLGTNFQDVSLGESGEPGQRMGKELGKLVELR
jgi:hypothetical protein